MEISQLTSESSLKIENREKKPCTTKSAQMETLLAFVPLATLDAWRHLISCREKKEDKSAQNNAFYARWVAKNGFSLASCHSAPAV